MADREAARGPVAAPSQSAHAEPASTAPTVVTMIQVMTVTSLANVKAHLSRFVDSVHDTHERVTITRNGEPAAVLMSPDDLASLEETIAVLSDPGLMAQVREADAAAAAGDVISLAEVLRQLRDDA